jgi:mannose-1-phosphate guanylyltransferase/mannose-6-phosphate isomerase
MVTHANAHLYAVILAGGSGVRFWPLSRELDPKQMLAIFGTDSLIVQAIGRIRPFVGARAGAIRLVTNERLHLPLHDHLADTLPDQRESWRFIVEPVGRNTAPALALAAALLVREDPAALMLVLPSDHLVVDGAVWTAAIRAAIALATAGYFATIGLRPTRPETGFGYILPADPLPAFNTDGVQPARVRRFIEKPPVAQAAGLVAQGEAYWNAGIVCLTAAQLLDELAHTNAAGRQIVTVCRAMAAAPMAHWMDDVWRLPFAALPAVSIDTALLEQSAQVAVVPADLQWQDVGSLAALDTLALPDAQGNRRVGRGVDIDAHDVTVYATERLVATVGVDELLVVDTRDATLICRKERCQDVRAVVEALHALGATEVAEPCKQLRRWGSWTTLQRGPGWRIRLIEVVPGAQTAIQRHQRRTEHWVVMEGTATIWCAGQVVTLTTNQSIALPPATTHGIANTTEGPLVLLEVQLGDGLADDDIERIELDPSWAVGGAG